MADERVHTICRESGWCIEVELDGSEHRRVLSTHQDREDAVEAGRTIARHRGVEHVVHAARPPDPPPAHRTVVHPDLDLWRSVLTGAVKAAADLPVRGVEDHAVQAFSARVHRSAQPLAHAIAQLQPLPVRDALLAIADRAMHMAAEVVRGLNDCLIFGELHGYVVVTEERVLGQVREVIDGLPSVVVDTPADAVAELRAWSAELDVQAVPLELVHTHPEIRVRQAFATIAVAAGMAARALEIGV